MAVESASNAAGKSGKGPKETWWQVFVSKVKDAAHAADGDQFAMDRIKEVVTKINLLTILGTVVLTAISVVLGVWE